MNVEFQPIKLDTAADGDLALMFHEAQERVAQDMVDPTKVKDGKRVITMSMVIEPSASEDSKEFTVSYDCQTKLAKCKGKASFGHMDSRGVLLEPKSEQSEFDFGGATVSFEGAG